jgi:hypothetical protein
MAHARLKPWPFALLLAACAAPLNPTESPRQAPAPPASSVSAASERPASGFWGAARPVSALGQGLVMPLPDVAGWRRNRSEKQSWVAEHRATSSSLVVRVWTHNRVARLTDCEQQARLWRRDLPEFGDGELVEARERVLAGSYAGRVMVGVREVGGAGLSGHVLAFASDARSCMFLSFSTAASGRGAARVVAERLGTMSKVFDRLERVGIDDRIRVQPL